MLRVNEVYTSIQGEGPFTGLPTQFVRFSGCNMRCPGWPCDTQHAIVPALYKNDPKYLGYQMFQESVVANWPRHLCLTGGEPFMQRGIDLQEFAEAAHERSYTLEAFTNGSFPFPSWVKRYGVRLMMDWKLPGSGEADTCLDQRLENFHQRLDLRDGVKFVVKDHRDLELATDIWMDLTGGKGSPTIPQFWVGRAWDTITDQELVQYVLDNELPWRLNVQMHKLIWPADARGV